MQQHISLKPIPAFLLWASLLSPLLLVSQTPIQCWSEAAEEELEYIYSNYQDCKRQTYQDALEAARTNRNALNEMYTIPIIVHLVWRTPEENIPDSIIEAQIAVLNEDFAALNADTAILRPIFDGVKGKSTIQFELDRIVRVQTDVNFGLELFPRPDVNLKNTANGGSSPISPDKYLNLWLCHLISPSAAYAYPPLNLVDYPLLNNWGEILTQLDPAYDGVVMDYRSIGGRGYIAEQEIGPPIPMEGRILVHEIGHYLGLMHPWGRFSCDAADDDGIEDTPSTDAPTNNCFSDEDTCTEDEFPNMWENYMDYADEQCKVIFTQGQVNLMQAVLEGPRRSLIEDVSNINETAFLEPILAYPNPLNDRLFVHLPQTNTTASLFELRIKDALGREVLALHKQAGGQQVVLDIASVPTGIYFLEINQSRQQQIIKLLVAR